MKTSTTLLTLLVTALLSASAVAAGGHREPVEDWTPAALTAALAAMPMGDAERGEQLHQRLMCDSCHGPRGIAPTANWPSVAGQKADYTYKMLLDYQTARRQEDRRSELMSALMPLLSAQDMADLAVFYAGLEPGAAAPVQVAALPPDLGRAERLVRKGDRARLISPCASCHGRRGQGGINAAPALAGQSPLAFTRTMQMYKTGQRDNDVRASMRQFAHRLSDDEIADLAAYYGAP